MPTLKDGSESRPGETLAQHKERVMTAAQDHAKAQKVAAQATTSRPPDGFPASPSTPSQIPEFMQKMGVTTPDQPKPESAPQAKPGEAPAQNGEEPEWQKVARERGWKTPADAINSYMSLEREFHTRMNQQRQQQPPPPPAYQPPPPPVYQQPVYMPQPQTPFVQQLARKHGISLEDAERLLPFVSDVSNAAAANAVQEVRSTYEPVVVDLQRKVARSEEQMEIANDPAMRVPRVQYEVNRILVENPTAFQFERQPLKWALDRALRNIAQELVRADQSYLQQVPGYPSQPPVTAGTPTGTRDNGAPSPGPKIDLAGNYFKLKTAAEKKEMLAAMGVVVE